MKLATHNPPKSNTPTAERGPCQRPRHHPNPSPYSPSSKTFTITTAPPTKPPPSLTRVATFHPNTITIPRRRPPPAATYSDHNQTSASLPPKTAAPPKPTYPIPKHAHPPSFIATSASPQQSKPIPTKIATQPKHHQNPTLRDPRTPRHHLKLCIWIWG